ncbi:adenylosuccinate synthase [Thermoplasmatales archaeon ex4572_165]|nr:MAG: adenylosuccinate synthase [Thermoplasmatales archaeon ex4572_165]
MTVKLVIGTQWGDEGKGKIVDYLSKNVEYVIRFQGGNNAGHTIIVNKEEYKLHIIPSGVISGKIGIIGNGCVIDPEILSNEIKSLEKRDIDVKLLISNRAHIIMPYHKLLDGAEERYLADQKIGTTKRGIGPCYSDKISRNGIRAGDILNTSRLQKKLERVIPIKQKMFEVYKIDEKLDQKEILNLYVNFGKQLKKYISDTHIIIQNAVNQEKNLLFEGAQGTMLDVDYGTYPYATSSHVIAGGASIGVGIPPKNFTEIIGIVKAYTTRVGEGPMTTELTDNVGQHLQRVGHEFGTTTSRPRRCGWLDLVVVKHSCDLSGITKIALTKLDVLNGLKKIKICMGYEFKGEMTDIYPYDVDDVADCKPIYKEFKGWDKIENIDSFSDLPKSAQDYILFIQEYLKTPISIVSVGPERNETMII